MRTLEKDILLIAKGWYDEDKYSNILEAFNAYYHKEYGCEDITMDKGFALELFLKPTIIEMNKYCPSIIRDLFSSSFREYDQLYSKDFTNIMYDRCLLALSKLATKGVVDFTDYEEMMNRRYIEDEELGIEERIWIV